MGAGSGLVQRLRRQRYVIVPLLLATLVFGFATSLYPTPPVIKDSLGYTRTAQRLLVHGTYSYSAEPASVVTTPNATVPPGYVLWLAGAYHVLRDAAASPDEAVAAVQPVVVGLQFLKALAIVVLIGMCGRELGGPRLGTFAGVTAALYLPFAWASSVALSELMGALLIAVQVLLALLAARKGRAVPVAHFAGLGATSALLGLVRPAYAFWAVIPVAYVLLTRRREPRRLAVALAAGCAAFVLVMAPWWVRNAVVLERAVLFRTDAGAPALDATGGQQLTEQERELAARAEAHGQDGQLAVAAERLRTAWVESPGAFVGVRLGRMWAAHTSAWNPVHDVYLDEYFEPQKPRIVVEPFTPPPSDAFVRSRIVAQWYHWLIAAGSIIALGFVRRSPRVLVLASVPLYSFAVHALTLFTDRYYFPAMPAVIAMSSAGWYGAYAWVRSRLRAPSPAEGDLPEEQAGPKTA